MLLLRFSKSSKRFLERHVSMHRLRKLAFLVSLLSCLTAGSPMLFSMFARAFHDKFGISYYEINLIGSATAIGMYFFLPVLGYLSDSYGPSMLSLISIWFYVPSFFFNAELIRNFDKTSSYSQWHIYCLCISFFLIGLATSSFYFSSLLTCAKIFPNHKGLAISLPVSCYGLSSLIGSQILRSPSFTKDNILDLYNVFYFFGMLYLVVCMLHFLTSSIVTVEADHMCLEQGEYISEQSHLINEHEESMDDDNELIPHSSFVDSSSHRSRYCKFIKDKSAWILMASLILNIGPLEAFQNNLGSIMNASFDTKMEISQQIGLLAAASTFARLLVGILIEYISSNTKKFFNRSILLLIIFIAFGCAVHVLLIRPSIPILVPLVAGASYGGLFTIYPTIVASIWGVEMMGSTWGTFMLAPAIGSTTFSLFYGKEFDSSCKSDNFNCLDRYFSITAFGFFCSLMLILLSRKRISSTSS